MSSQTSQDSANPFRIEKANQRLINQSIVNIQPMTAPLGGLNFIRLYYGSKTPLQKFTEQVWEEE